MVYLKGNKSTIRRIGVRSKRRKEKQEDDENVENNQESLRPILCDGEEAKMRESREQRHVVKKEKTKEMERDEREGDYTDGRRKQRGARMEDLADGMARDSSSEEEDERVCLWKPEALKWRWVAMQRMDRMGRDVEAQAGDQDTEGKMNVRVEEQMNEHNNGESKGMIRNHELKHCVLWEQNESSDCIGTAAVHAKEAKNVRGKEKANDDSTGKNAEWRIDSEESTGNNRSTEVQIAGIESATHQSEDSSKKDGDEAVPATASQGEELSEMATIRSRTALREEVTELQETRQDTQNNVKTEKSNFVELARCSTLKEDSLTAESSRTNVVTGKMKQRRKFHGRAHGEVPQELDCFRCQTNASNSEHVEEMKQWRKKSTEEHRKAVLQEDRLKVSLKKHIEKQKKREAVLIQQVRSLSMLFPTNLSLEQKPQQQQEKTQEQDQPQQEPRDALISDINMIRKRVEDIVSREAQLRHENMTLSRCVKVLQESKVLQQYENMNLSQSVQDMRENENQRKLKNADLSQSATALICSDEKLQRKNMDLSHSIKKTRESEEHLRRDNTDLSQQITVLKEREEQLRRESIDLSRSVAVLKEKIEELRRENVDFSQSVMVLKESEQQQAERIECLQTELQQTRVERKIMAVALKASHALEKEKMQREHAEGMSQMESSLVKMIQKQKDDYGSKMKELAQTNSSLQTELLALKSTMMDKEKVRIAALKT